MLRHLETVPTTTATAAAAVTDSSHTPETQTAPAPLPASYSAEEIAHAIAALEKERYLTESSQTHTTQIADILNQLQLELTPAEVQAKIEQERQERATLAQQVQQSSQRRRRLFLGGIAAIFPAIILMMFLRASTPPLQVAPVSPPVAIQNTVAVNTVGGVNQCASYRAPVSGDRYRSIQRNPRAKYARRSTGRKSASRSPPTSSSRCWIYRNVSSDTFVAANKWTVFHKGETLYLSAFTDARQSHSALLTDPTLLLQNIRTTGSGMYAPVAVSVPINAITIQSTNDMSESPYHQFHVQLKDIDRIDFGK